MKKSLAFILVCILCVSAMISQVFAATEDELIISLFDGTADGWLDNAEGTRLTVEEVDGKTALKHEMMDSSISLKRKFEVDWSKYERDNIYIIAEIHVDEALSETVAGTLKIKNGDSVDDTGNTEENNELNFAVADMKLQAGWNTLEFALKDAEPNKGDDYKIADWFCMWVNDNEVPVEVSIGKLDIVNRVTVPDETVTEAVTEAESAETAAPETVAETVAETEAVAESAPQTSDISVTTLAILAVSGIALAVIAVKMKKAK